MISKRSISASLAALSLVLVQGCATADTLASDTLAANNQVQAEIAPPGAIPGPALWLVSDEDTTIYLFGTVHALKKDVSWMDSRIERAFSSADVLVTEIDMAKASSSGQNMAAAGLLPAGQNLRDMMTPEDREEFEAAVTAVGLPVDALDRLEPWFAAMTLSLIPVLQAGYAPDNGVDITLSNGAEGKQRDALETIDQQIALFDGLPPETQLSFLDQAVESMPQAAESLGTMVDEWLEGDADGLAALLNAELTDPILHARLLTDRNVNWAGWIQQRLDTPGTVFMAVGAGHLAGRDSVQELLQRRGLQVRRIWK